LADLTIEVLSVFKSFGRREVLRSASLWAHPRTQRLRQDDAEVVWCHDGTTEGLGTPQEAVTHFRFQQAYLGSAD